MPTTGESAIVVSKWLESQDQGQSAGSGKQVNVAVVGLGFGAEFLPIYQKHPNANVAAICRRNEAELNKVGDAMRVEKRYAKYEDVLADPGVDFVHINSPIPDHAWMSVEALKAEKHVLCTVPMATTIEDCEKIRDLVAQTGCVGPPSFVLYKISVLQARCPYTGHD